MTAATEQTPAEALILVADDDADIRELIAVLLRRSGFAVIECADGHDALKAAVHHRPDLLMLDIGMPKLDGHAVWRVVRNLGAEAPPLVFITGRNRPQDKIHAKNIGAADYLMKPFSSAKLVERVKAVLGERAARPRRAHDSAETVPAPRADSAEIVPAPAAV